MYGYINYDKLDKLWHNETAQDQRNYLVMKRLSHLYVRDILVQAILTSKKMPNNGKPLHLKVRRSMLKYFHDKQAMISS